MPYVQLPLRGFIPFNVLKKLFRSTRKVLAFIGIIVIGISIFLGGFKLKTMLYYHPAHEVAAAVLNKIGINSSFIYEPIEPGRPADIQFPDPGSDTWRGHGAKKDRTLQPIVYENEIKPVPSQWMNRQHREQPVSYTTPEWRNKITVQSSDGFLKAITQAKPGDVIVLSPGVYTVLSSNIILSSSGTSKNPICVKAETLGQVRIELENLEGFRVSAPYWIFENIEFKGISSDHDNCEHAFHIVGPADGFVLRNCRLHEFSAMIKANGIDVGNGNRQYPDHALIENNTFYNSETRRTAKPVTFIDVVGSNDWIVRGNFISDFSKGRGNQVSFAVFFKGNGKGNILENNLVIGEYRHKGGTRIGLSFGGDGTGKRFFRDGKTTIEHTDGIMRNNIIMYCNDAGIHLNRSANTKIINNMVYKTEGIDVISPESSAVIQNTLMTGKIMQKNGSKAVLSDNIIIKDKIIFKKGFKDWFMDPDNADFTFKKKGPFINKGRPSTDIFDDFCGQARKGYPDIGAFEYNNDSQTCTLVGN